MKNSVLIIDTDLENCKLIKYNLMNTDTEAYYTHSVSEALQKLQTKQYSLIIMDVLLSTIDGVEMLKVMPILMTDLSLYCRIKPVLPSVFLR